MDAHPNHTRARLFLKDAESSLDMYYDEDRERVTEKHNAILDTPVTDFELSVRARNCLKTMNVYTLGDLLRISDQSLLAYKNFGETSLHEIKAMLQLKGLDMGQLSEQSSPAASPEAMPKLTARADFTDLRVQIHLLPLFQHLRFALSQVAAHRECRIRQVQSRFIIGHCRIASGSLIGFVRGIQEILPNRLNISKDLLFKLFQPVELLLRTDKSFKFYGQ